ncbi:hypothetical protein GWI33_005014 [Rhynchophorus ferrugineus]|uniref:Uncharacterized protein n=1 Tax=Rhynchophorus ferrugineus TaxID=354439 RepID=A0A834IJY3_RHYFE|nr:hypothetical protein GWI33_005014 [Rhynchophorus ferrugineus]
MLASQTGLPEVAGDNHNQVNWKQMYEESRKESARLQEQVAHLSTQIEVLTKTIQATANKSEDGFQIPNSRKKKRLTLMSHQEKKPKLTGPTVTDDHTINPPRKKQPMSRPWLTSTPSTSEGAKLVNFKTPKQPVPKTSAETTYRKRKIPSVVLRDQ